MRREKNCQIEFNLTLLGLLLETFLPSILVSDLTIIFLRYLIGSICKLSKQWFFVSIIIDDPPG